MVRGLVIRKIFIGVDLILAGAIAVMGGLVAVELTRPARQPGDTGASAEGPKSGEVQALPQVAARAAYDALVKSGLFGDAGRWDPKAAPPASEAAPPASDVVAETSLNLRLIGTIALSPKSPFSVGFVENMDLRDAGKGYLVGDTIMEKVTLEEVYAREVIVLNQRFSPPKRERLRMDEAEEAGAPQVAAAGPAPTPPPGEGSAKNISLKRDEVIQDIYANYADLVTNVKPELAKDSNGNVIGVTAPNIGQVPLAQKLGIQDNDVLQTVNNERIDSEEKILEIVQKYQNASSFRIGIMRDGKPTVITYRLD